MQNASLEMDAKQLAIISKFKFCKCYDHLGGATFIYAKFSPLKWLITPTNSHFKTKISTKWPRYYMGKLF